MADLSYGFTLPNYGNPIEALQQAGQQNERRAERDAALAQRQAQQAKQDAKDAQDDIWKRTKLVQDETNPEKIATGDITADQYLGNKAKEVMQSILTDPNFKSLPANELYGMIQQKWLPVIQGSQAMKDRIAQSDAVAIAQAKQDPNLDINRLKVDLRKSAIGSVLKPDANGQTQFKPDDIYDPTKLLTPENYHNYAMSGQPVIDFIEKTKTKPFEGGYKKMPDGSIVPYKGQETPFSTLNIKPNETGMFGLKDDPKYSVRTTDDFVTENGKSVPVKILAADIQDQIRQNPSVQGALNKMWADYKKQNNIPTASPAEDEKRKYAYAVGVFQQHDPSSITSLTPQHLPRNITNINMGGGNLNATKEVTNDFDKISDYQYPAGAKIVDGIFYNKDGSVMKAQEVDVPIRNLPLPIVNRLTESGLFKPQEKKGQYGTDMVTIKVVDGVPQYIATKQTSGNKEGAKFTRDNNFLLQQKEGGVPAKQRGFKGEEKLTASKPQPKPKAAATPNKKSTGKKEIPNF